MPTKTCSAYGCNNKIVCRGLCKAHYHRLLRYGSPNGKPQIRQHKIPKKCKEHDCDEDAVSLGYCRLHYRRFHVHGTTKQTRSKNGLHKQYHSEYNSYSAMLSRCYILSNPSYNRYGGKGIKVCDRWRGPYGFENFIKDMGRKPNYDKLPSGFPLYSLDRVNNSKSYSPNNCKWSTTREQAINRKKKNTPFASLTGYF